MCISLWSRKIEESRQINNEKEKTERDVSLYSSFFFGAKFICFCLYSKQLFYLKSLFKLYIQKKKLKLLLIRGLLHILTLITFYQAFLKSFFVLNILCFLCQFGVCSCIFGQIITLEKFQLKGWQNDECLNMYNL